MKIEIITEDDPLYILPFFDEFLRNYGSDFQVVHVSLCRTMGKRPRKQMVRELTLLYGPLGFSRLLGRAAAARIGGLFSLPRTAKRFHTLPQLCKAFSISYEHTGNPNDTNFVARLRERAPDLLVSVACPHILKKSVLDIPPLGCINIHHAPLPRYKGMMPSFWQLYHGERKAGLTIHFMSSELDQGAALFQGGLEIEAGESLDHLILRSKRYGAHCMAKVLDQLRSGTQQAVVLDQSTGSYFTFPRLEEIRDFKRRGLRAI